MTNQTTPCGAPLPVPARIDSGYGPCDAFMDGRNSYNAGLPISLAAEWPEDLRGEWIRGFKNTRQQDRFAATIRRRRESRS